MYKEYLEKFLSQQMNYMNKLRNDPDCIDRLYHQAYGVCSFVNDCLLQENLTDEAKWVRDTWQTFLSEIFLRFGYQG